MPIKPGPTKLCAGICGQDKDRFADFAPRWGHCPAHKPWDETCSECQRLRGLPTRQPRCYDCDKVREKKASGKGKGKGKGKTTKKPVAATAEAESTTETPSEPKAATETTAALVANGVAVDAHGPLTRPPYIPRRGIAVHLRRGLTALRNRCKRVAVWERAVRKAKARADVLTERDDPKLPQAKERVATLQTKLNAALVARAFTKKNVDQCVVELQSRTLKNANVKARYGYKRFERLLERVDDIVDTAYVQAGSEGSSDAFARIVTRIGSHFGKLVNKRVRYETMRVGKQLAEETARACRDAGIYRGVSDYNPDHKSKASLSTRCYMPVLRALQVRTKADRAEGVLKTGEGWQSGSVSLSAIMGAAPATGQEFSEPFQTRYSTKCPQKCLAATQDQARREEIKLDVGAALSALDSESDRQLVRMFYAEDQSRKAIAETLGMTMTAVNARLQVVLDKLRDQLTPYEDFGWSND